MVDLFIVCKFILILRNRDSFSHIYRGIGILRRLHNSIRHSVPLPLYVCSPVAVNIPQKFVPHFRGPHKTVPRTVAPRPSKPFYSCKQNKKPSDWMVFRFGSGIGIRTPTNRVRVCRANRYTIPLYSSAFYQRRRYSITDFCDCQEFFCFFTAVLAFLIDFLIIFPPKSVSPSSSSAILQAIFAESLRT